MTHYLLLLLGIFSGSLVGTWVVRNCALAHNVVDVPNERSSHTVPTPRGGGLAIVCCFLAAILLLTAWQIVPLKTTTALVGAGLLVGAIGFLDDRGHVKVRWRLMVHFTAAMWGLYWIGGLPPILILHESVTLRLAVNALAVIALVWVLNLFNLMDGIDGIAGVEVVTVCIGALLLNGLVQSNDTQWLYAATLAAAALGFLIWNFPPAKIFMGDVGSGTMGILLGLLALLGARHSGSLLWGWLILLGVFVVDATVTLLRRSQRGERVYEAHRTHAYQHAAIRFRSHRVVTVAVAAVNLFWLLPIAVLVGTERLHGVFGVLLAYAPLTWVALRFNAGLPISRNNRSTFI